MEALRSWLSPKDRQPWKALLNIWELFQFEYLIPKHDKDWNPWSTWCRSWEAFEKSHSKIPKSGKERAEVWRELYDVALFTEKMLNEAKDKCRSLKKQRDDFQKENLLWKEKCRSLQEDLNGQMQRNAMEAERHRQELAIEASESLKLKQQIDDLWREKKELEKEAAKWPTLQKQRISLRSITRGVDQRLEEQRVDVQKVLNEGLRLFTKLQDQVSNLEMEVRNLSREKNREPVRAQEEWKWELVDVFSGSNYNQYIVFSVDDEFMERMRAGEVGWHDMAMRPGVGCPSREKIFNRLMPYKLEESIQNGTYWHQADAIEGFYNTYSPYTYWQLVLQLSRYEDLASKNSGCPIRPYQN